MIEAVFTILRHMALRHEINPWYCMQCQSYSSEKRKPSSSDGCSGLKPYSA